MGGAAQGMLTGRISEEKVVVGRMVSMYCKGKGHGRIMCPECAGLLRYAEARLDSCRFSEDKPSCSKCRVHCYKPEMRRKIKAVMRYAGPRMLFCDPCRAIRHLLGQRG